MARRDIDWSLGREPDVFGLGIPSPTGANRDVHEFVERVHDVAVHLFVPLLAFHVLGAIKHAVFDRRGAGLRMFKPSMAAGDDVEVSTTRDATAPSVDAIFHARFARDRRDLLSPRRRGLAPELSDA